MRQSTKQQEYFNKICEHIKRMYAERGEILSEQEALVATQNWLGFCEKLCGIKDNERDA